MTLSTGSSFIVAAISSFILFSFLQLVSTSLAASNPGRLVGGAGCAVLFLTLLTALGNLEGLLSRRYRTSWIEVILCLGISEICASSIHGVCVTTGFMFSVLVLFYVHRVSASKS
eukprot:gb/GECH01013645.1/.p1 GENE.gb/GECH01013645.1/~~gb/GECH01013645.1/.p1  ORF type:complete len:115 (+),score=7.26 gb/GECH01013645.1/:1-345(+)